MGDRPHLSRGYLRNPAPLPPPPAPHYGELGLGLQAETYPGGHAALHVTRWEATTDSGYTQLVEPPQLPVTDLYIADRELSQGIPSWPDPNSLPPGGAYTL